MSGEVVHLKEDRPRNSDESKWVWHELAGGDLVLLDQPGGYHLAAVSRRATSLTLTLCDGANLNTARHYARILARQMHGEKWRKPRRKK